MLSVEQNKRLTEVSKGTPMGELMRRYWHPIAAVTQLTDEHPTMPIRLLGEDLVLYKDSSGTLGLIEPSCPHRKASLLYGVPEDDGLRCCYHGWLFNEKGQCVDQPSEPVGSNFKDKVQIVAYPVEALGGLVFAYLGPQPVPLLPRWDILVWPGIREAFKVELPCNWLQCQENSLDPLHFQWLHTYYGGWVMNRKRTQEERDEFLASVSNRGAAHHKIGFEITDYGVIKRRLVGNETEADEFWRIGHPILFPNILRVGNSLQFRVPIDNTHTTHMVLFWKACKEGEEALAPNLTPMEIKDAYYPPTQEDAAYGRRLRDDYVLGQDQTAWAAQGSVSDRTTERLGVSDVGIIMFRRLLDSNATIVEDGGEPINVHRTPEDIIVLPIEHFIYPGETQTGGPFRDSVPRKPDIEALLSGAEVKQGR
jgi:5,5'-dehydrodivanillate O-demethylase